MSLRKILIHSIVLLIFPLLSVATQAKIKLKFNAETARPPQFVMLAFDGSLANEFWDESQLFAETVLTSQSSKLLRFTYFVSPVYYLEHTKKDAYTTPGLGFPRSCIGWSDSRENIVPRIDRTNRAFEGGHEIGSHANAHCDQTGLDSTDPMFGHPWGGK